MLMTIIMDAVASVQEVQPDKSETLIAIATIIFAFGLFGTIGYGDGESGSIPKWTAIILLVIGLIGLIATIAYRICTH